MTEENNPQLQAFVGKRKGPYLSFQPVSRTQIWQWCSAMGDNNPLYNTESNNAPILAPPAMMQMWTMRDFNDNYAPGSTHEAPYQIFDYMKTIGLTANVAVSYDIHFIRYLEEGERPQHFTRIDKISDRKTTALGEGYFVTEKVEFTTTDNKPFAEALITYFQYQPAKETEASPSHKIKKQQAITETNWQPDFKTPNVMVLNEGDTLPVLNIPITHRLIVGGAIASQDFIPVHHNVEAAKQAAMPDIFMNILTTCGLSARYLSDWGGTNSRLQKLSFRLMAPNHPGDTMTMQGQIKKLTELQQQTQVNIAFSGNNQLGLHVAGEAELLLHKK